MKRILIIILILVSFISACAKNQKIYTPDPSEYVDWDGNYFYYENVRYTSDLKLEELYITKITYNDNTYFIKNVISCLFKDDKVHMTFYIDLGLENEETTSKKKIAYAIYSLENKEAEYLYIYESNDYDNKILLNKIIYVSDNYTIISGIEKLSKIDIKTNEIKTVYCDSYEVKNGYAAIKNDNELFVSTIEEFKFEKIMDLTHVSSNFDYYIHNVNEKPLLQLIDQKSTNVNNQYINTNSLTYYDFESKNFYELVSFKDNKFLSKDYKNTSMFILGEPKLVGYNGHTTDDKDITYELFIENNILYTVEFDEINNLKLKELHNFKSINNNEEYTIKKIEDNIICIYKRYFNRPVNHMYYNRIDNSIVYFDINNNSFIDKEDYDSKIIIAENEHVVYYIKIKIEEKFMALDNKHYYLYRLDKTTKEEDLLNYFKNQIGEFRFSKYLNENRFDVKFLVRNS